MDALRSQVELLTNELTTLKQELVNVKGTHANLHQQTVDANSATARKFSEQGTRVDALETQVNVLSTGAGSTRGFEDKGRKPLIKPEQVAVNEFKGSMTDSRACFLEWCEKVHDRVELYEDGLVKAMLAAEKKDATITAEESSQLGVSPQASKQLQGFLKDKTSGTAAAVVRGNDGGLGLESWRRLHAQFNPKTIRGTLQSQH